MKIGMEEDGFTDLEGMLKRLPEQMQARIYRQALVAAAKPIVQIAKDMAPRSSRRGPMNRIVDNIVAAMNKRGSKLGEFVISIITRKAYNPVTNVGDRRIKARSGKDAFFSVWYEFGKRGQEATPYMAPALQKGATAAVEAFRTTMKKRVDKAKIKTGIL